MNFGDQLRWFAETDAISLRLLEHLRLSFFPVLAALLVALPLGLYIGHTRRFQLVTVSIANLGRAVPSFAILALALPLSIKLGLGLGFWPTFVALFFLSVPPIVTNSYIGVKDVDADVVEAGRGVGLTEGQLLRRIELPLAAPLIVAGVRTAAVQSVATATLAALVAGGGLGDFIRYGFRAREEEFLLGGAILVAALALVTEILLGFAEKKVRPRSHASLLPFDEVTETSGPAPAGGG